MSNSVKFWVSKDNSSWIDPRFFVVQEKIIKSLESLEPLETLESLQDRLWSRVLENEARNPELKKLIIEKNKE